MNPDTDPIALARANLHGAEDEPEGHGRLRAVGDAAVALRRELTAVAWALVAVAEEVRAIRRALVADDEPAT